MRVTGIGGIFFKAEDPKALAAWYRKHLHIDFDGSYTTFEYGKPGTPNEKGSTTLQFSPTTTKYFEPSEKQFMLNLRVVNLATLLEELRAEGVTVLEGTETYDFGSFGRIMDPEGNKIELWEPANETE